MEVESITTYSQLSFSSHLVAWNLFSKAAIRLRLHGAIYSPDSFVFTPRYCVNLKEIRYESMSLNRIVADKSHRVILALHDAIYRLRFYSNSLIHI